MRYRHRFMIYNDDNGTIDFLNETNCKLNDRTTYFTIDLYSDNPEDMRIANILYEMGKIGGRVEEYTQIELDTAPWLATLPIWNDYYAEPSGGTPLKGKTFRPIKEPVCKKCYANLVQNTDIHIRPNLSKIGRASCRERVLRLV